MAQISGLKNLVNRKTFSKRGEMKKDKTITVASVGRHLHLGMLYDCRNESYVPGVYLWDMENIEKNKVVSERPQTFVNISLSDSLEEKTKLLKLSSSLSMSVYAGLVKVEGSSSYMNDTSTSVRECRATIQYHVMTRTEHLNLSQMGKKKNIHKLSATHVITGVEYGAEALMVFSEKATTETEKKSISANLKTMLNKMNVIPVTAEGKVEMSEEEKKKVQNFACTFYGDFDLEENPANFEQAVKVYRELPKLLGSNREKAVPKKFWLVPLKEVMSSAPKLKHEISEINCNKLQSIMELVNKAQMRANDLIRESDLIKASDTAQKMKTFEAKIQKYVLVLKENLMKLLPEIRKGEEKEEKLEKLFKLLAESPFSYTNMDEWLKEKETEVSIVKSYIDDIHVPEAQVIAPEDIDKMLFDPSNKSVWAFVFTSLGEDDLYLKDLEIFLRSEKFNRMEGLPDEPLSNQKKTPWYKSAEVSKSMRESLKAFNKGAADRNLSIISYINYPFTAGAAVRLYTNCHLDYVNYQNKYEPEIINVDTGSITMKSSTKSSNLPFSYNKVSGNDKGQEQKMTWPTGQELLVITDLIPDSTYEFHFGKHNAKLLINTKPIPSLEGKKSTGENGSK
ncbi:verrucotoxin subunit beta-like [Hoplias malabaricus]|uniref:verrucotoxin subunit beta-like n=1 Tax=Hoplias malabaricus TaxID=27720 RepID=UPI003462B2DE